MVSNRNTVESGALRVEFVLFGDTCSLNGHSEPCMTIVCIMLINHIKPESKMGSQPGDCSLPQGSVCTCMSKLISSGWS